MSEYFMGNVTAYILFIFLPLFFICFKEIFSLIEIFSLKNFLISFDFVIIWDFFIDLLNILENFVLFLHILAFESTFFHWFLYFHWWHSPWNIDLLQYLLYKWKRKQANWALSIASDFKSNRLDLWNTLHFEGKSRLLFLIKYRELHNCILIQYWFLWFLSQFWLYVSNSLKYAG